MQAAPTSPACRGHSQPSEGPAQGEAWDRPGSSDWFWVQSPQLGRPIPTPHLDTAAVSGISPTTSTLLFFLSTGSEPSGEVKVTILPPEPWIPELQTQPLLSQRSAGPGPPGLLGPRGQPHPGASALPPAELPLPPLPSVQPRPLTPRPFCR